MTIKFSLFNELKNKYEYNFETFEDLLNVYSGKNSNDYGKGQKK